MQNRIIKIFLRVIFLVAFAGSVFAQVNLALNKPCVASSIENVDLNAAAAFDGNSGTRWSSVFSDPQWIYVDLGATYAISRVVLNWETAFASGYSIQVSGNAGSWTTVYATSTGNGGIDDLAVSGSGRYLRLYGTARGTEWGYSLWEFEVYGGGSVTATPTAIPTATPATAAGNVALNRSAVSSSNENTDLTAGMAFDGNGNTRWASAYSDPQWIYVDLGTTYSISRVVLNWETAYGSAYSIQVSGNASAWTTVYSTSGGNGGIDDLTVNGSGRYVRMYGTTRG
ncbi:MAG: discoidin domain-containing protein, partial [Spirochaetales bacterium]|nr:discoidin domain-containing protein [Spirochaetales bacterium]